MSTDTLEKTTASTRPGGFIWYELLTDDADRAGAFYGPVVGWRIEEHSAFPNGYRMIGRDDGRSAGGVLPLTAEMRANGARPAWLGYLHCADVDATAGAIRADGGQVHLEPFDIPGVGRVAMVSDPHGAPFYIMAPIPPAGQPEAVSDVFSVDQPQRVRWNELTTPDPARAIVFYERHFGWEQRDSMPMGAMGDYQFLWHGGVRIGAVMPRPDPAAPAGWTYYVGVDEIDRAARAVSDGGGTILNGPMEIPGGEFALVALDAQGARLGLVGPRHQ